MSVNFLQHLNGYLLCEYKNLESFDLQNKPFISFYCVYLCVFFLVAGEGMDLFLEYVSPNCFPSSWFSSLKDVLQSIPWA